MAVAKAKTFLHYTIPASQPSMWQRFLSLFPMYNLPERVEKSNPKRLKPAKAIVVTKRRGRPRKVGSGGK